MPRRPSATARRAPPASPEEAQERLKAAADAAMTRNTSAPVPRTRNTVTVACKIPCGLVLRLHRIVEREFPTPGGGFHKEKLAEQYGDVIRINGYSAPAGGLPYHGEQVIGGYALTTGVDRDYFAKWMEQNKDLDLVKNHLIFAHEHAADTQAEAREKAHVFDGLGPITPDKDPRLVKVDSKFRKNVGGLETVTDRPAA